MAPVCRVPVSVRLGGRVCPALTRLVMLGVTYMVYVMVDPVNVSRAGVGHTAPWMSVPMLVQAMVSAPTPLQGYHGHGLVTVRQVGQEGTAQHSWR